jgi:hypothetical protein
LRGDEEKGVSHSIEGVEIVQLVSDKVELRSCQLP